MSKEITQFIGRVKELAENNGLAGGIAGSGSPSKTSVMADLYKEAIGLREADDPDKEKKHLDEIVGILHVAQAMNVIGFNDLEELMILLENISNEG